MTSPSNLHPARASLLGQIDPANLNIDTSISGWDIGFAVATLLATWILARLVHRGVLGVLGRVPSGVSEDLRRLTARITKYFVWAIGLGVSLTFVGAQIQPLLSAAIIVAVIGALVLRGIAENFGAGLVIQTRRPIQLGDHIEALGHTGTVSAINGRAVVIETFDGRTVHLPNAQVLQAPIVNDSVHGRRRSELEVRAAAGHDRISHILDTISHAIDQTSAVDHDGAPSIDVSSIEPNRVRVLVKVWHACDAETTARRDVMQAIAAALVADNVDAVVITPPPAPPLTPASPI